MEDAVKALSKLGYKGIKIPHLGFYDAEQLKTFVEFTKNNVLEISETGLMLSAQIVLDAYNELM